METVFVFPSTHHLLRGEELLKRRGFLPRLVPAPPQAGEACATAIAVPSSERKEIARCLQEEGIQVKAVLSRESRFERSLARAVERVGSGQKLPASLLETLGGLRTGEGPETGMIAGLLHAAEGEGGEALAAVAEEAVRDHLDGKVSALVGLRVHSEIVNDAPLRGLEALTEEMREQGFTHLFLDLGGIKDLPWMARELAVAADQGIIVVVAVRQLTAGWGELVSKGWVRQVLLPVKEVYSLSPAELAQEIVFLRDNHPGPLGSGNLLPLLNGRLEAAKAAEKRRLRGIIAVCRIVLGDVFLPIPPSLWREGGLGGANMLVLEVTGRPLAGAIVEAESRLQEMGLSFIRAGRSDQKDGEVSEEAGA